MTLLGVAGRKARCSLLYLTLRLSKPFLCYEISLYRLGIIVYLAFHFLYNFLKFEKVLPFVIYHRNQHKVNKRTKQQYQIGTICSVRYV